MSAHPNVILMALLKPDELSRGTMRNILEENDADAFGDILICDDDYHPLVMESEYHDDFQISADEGDLVFFDMITYGYGECIAWNKLEERKFNLEKWAEDICNRHHCSYEIKITANYW